MSEKRYSWPIEQELWYLLDQHAKTNHLSRYDVLNDKALEASLVNKLIAKYGQGPHDCLKNIISVGSKVVVGVAEGRTSVLRIGTVTDIDYEQMKVHIQFELNNGDKTELKSKLAFTERMMVI